MGTRIQTIADIADLAGVSKSTVSRALDDSPLIGAETKERIRAIVREHGFERNQAARRLSLGQSHVVAFVTYDFTKGDGSVPAFVLEIMSGVAAGLHANGYDLLLVQVAPDDTDWVRRYLDSGRVDGFVLMAGTCSAKHIRALEQREAPFITWGIPSHDRSHSWVTGDGFAGGKLATRHLLEQGRRRIALIGGPEMQIEAQDRHAGYEAALGEAGLEVDPALVEHTDFTAPAGVAALRRLLERAPDLDAVFAVGDAMAIAVMEELRAQGRSVPGDVAVVGYDDLELAKHANPPLTTVSQSVPLAGRIVAENLIQVLRTGAVTNVSLPAQLVVRESA